MSHAPPSTRRCSSQDSCPQDSTREINSARHDDKEGGLGGYRGCALRFRTIARAIPSALRALPTVRWSEELLQLFCREFHITKDGPQQPRAEGLARVNGNGSGPSIRVPQEHMAAARPFDNKSRAFKSPDKFFPLDSGQASHTETCWIPTSSRERAAPSSSSRHNSMTSRTRFINVSRVFACV